MKTDRGVGKHANIAVIQSHIEQPDFMVHGTSVRGPMQGRGFSCGHCGTILYC